MNRTADGAPWIVPRAEEPDHRTERLTGKAFQGVERKGLPFVQWGRRPDAGPEASLGILCRDPLGGAMHNVR